MGPDQAPGCASVRPVGIRWTVGDVSARGFEALRLSIWGAWHLFGAQARYAVCVNNLAAAEARERTGAVPEAVAWRDATQDVPPFLCHAFGAGMAQGVAWKLAPLRLFPDRHEIALDNDCILWDLPPSLAAWLARGEHGACLMAQDVRACYGRFAPQCPQAAFNAGIRGLPPGFDLEAALRAALARCGAAQAALHSELDEQGLQVAALSLAAPLQAVPLEEVTVCSPFHPHLPHLGRCGAHFVGLNARHIAWDYYGRPADAWMAAHWQHHGPELVLRTRAPADAALALPG